MLKATLVTMIFALPIFASPALGAPLLSKTDYSGFTMPQWAYSSVCEIHADKVLLKRSFGAESSQTLGFTEERAISLEGHVANLIELASRETAEETPAPCDGPSYTLSAFKEAPNDGSADEAVVLSTSGGCSQPRVVRDGPASRVLINLIESLCPKI